MSRLRETIADPRKRRIGYAAAALLLTAFCFFPRPYVSRAQVVPQDSSSVGLGSMLAAFGGQLQSFAALLGGSRESIDMYLAISRSTEVSDAVIRELKLVGPGGYASLDRAQVALAHKVDVHSLTGGIIEVTVRGHDAERTLALSQAYVRAISDRLVSLGRQRVQLKRNVVSERFQEASDRVAKTEAALNAFRRKNGLAAPEQQLGAQLSLRTGLQAQLQAKQVELQTLARFQSPQNPQIQAVQSAIASLRAQIAQTASPGNGAAGPNVAGLSALSSDYLNLYRDYRFAQALYEVYAQASEQVAVDQLAADTASDVQVIEAPHLDPDRKLNIPAVALLILVALAALFTEVYAPATGIELRLWSRKAAP